VHEFEVHESKPLILRFSFATIVHDMMAAICAHASPSLHKLYNIYTKFLLITHPAMQVQCAASISPISSTTIQGNSGGADTLCECFTCVYKQHMLTPQHTVLTLTFPIIKNLSLAWLVKLIRVSSLLSKTVRHLTFLSMPKSKIMQDYVLSER